MLFTKEVGFVITWKVDNSQSTGRPGSPKHNSGKPQMGTITQSLLWRHHGHRHLSSQVQTLLAVIPNICFCTVALTVALLTANCHCRLFCFSATRLSQPVRRQESSQPNPIRQGLIISITPVACIDHLETHSMQFHPANSTCFIGFHFFFLKRGMSSILLIKKKFREMYLFAKEIILKYINGEPNPKETALFLLPLQVVAAFLLTYSAEIGKGTHILFHQKNWAEDWLFLFFWLCPQHAEVPRPGIKPVPELWPAPQLWPCWILHLLGHMRISRIGYFLTRENTGGETVAGSSPSHPKLGELHNHWQSFHDLLKTESSPPTFWLTGSHWGASRY